MRRLLLAVLLGCCISFSLTGCGGCGTTEADMRAYAIRRSSDNDEAKPPPKKPVPAPTKKVDKTPSKAAPHVKSATATVQKPEAAETPAPPQTPEAAAGLPAPVAKPDAPLTVTQRRTMTIENLTNLSSAIRRHLQEKGTYPGDHGSNLSWRVMLLPYLNQTALFDQFHLDEPWDSPHNKALLPLIPAVYRSPERFDERTNYLLLVNDPAAYSTRLRRYVDRRRFGDGLEKTILLIEAADAHAVPWTKPQDFDLTGNKVETQLGKLRADGLFVVFADGHLGLLPSGMSPALIMTLVTCDSGDNPQPALALVATLTAEPKTDAVASADSAAAGGSIPETGLDVVDPLAPSPIATGSVPTSPAPKEPATAAPDTSGDRRPVPDTVEINKAKVLLEEIYRSRIDAARNREDQARLAKEMLEDLSRLKDDPAGQYVLLEGVRKIALQASDAVTALEAVEELGRRFGVNATTMRIEAVSEFARSGSFADEAANEIVLNYAIGLMNQALAEDNFVGAQKMYDIAVTAARRVQDTKLVRQLQEHKEEVAVARAAYAEVEKVIDELGADPYAPKPNLTVGKYYCFVKGEWSRGLPMLARGDDEVLRQLAEIELDPPALAEKQLELAERWWTVGEKHPMPLRRQMQLRAVSWYRKAQANLPDGLRKVKVEVRLREAERVYGREVVGEASVAGRSSR